MKLLLVESLNHSFFYCLDTLPTSISHPFLPETDSIIRTTDSQDIPTQTPADPPDDAIKFQDTRLPITRVARVGSSTQRPDPHRLVLARARDVAFAQQTWTPRHIPDPICVTAQCAQRLVRAARRLESPQLH